jgi:hypothetical protein
MVHELPDTCPFAEQYGEIDEMIRDLAHEKDLPDGIHPDCVGPDPDYHHYWGNGQEERHQQSVEWRVKLFWELKARPEWVAAWRAAKRLDERIRALCERKGLRFAPWEVPPWRAPDELPPGFRPQAMHSYDASLPQAVELRRQLIAELRAGE